MDPIKIYYFISRFLDNDMPKVTSNFKEFLVKDGIIEMLIMFITQNFPDSVKEEIKLNESKLKLENITLSTSSSTSPTTTTTTIDSIDYSNSVEYITNKNNKLDTSVELMKSYKVMNLFLHSSPPFISLVKEKLPIIISSLFEIFENENINNNKTAINNSLPNIHHFSKVLSSLFYQYTFDFLNQLSEIEPKSQKMYFQLLLENIHHTPIQDLFIIIAKRASANVNEYQTSNPVETKKIQKTLQKSKIFSMISSFFTLQQPQQSQQSQQSSSSSLQQSTNGTLDQSTSIYSIKNEKKLLIMEGITDFILKCIEQLDIYGPDIGFTISSFQNKEFFDNLIKILLVPNNNSSSSSISSNSGNKKESTTTTTTTTAVTTVTTTGQSYIHKKQCLSIITLLCKQSIEHTKNNEHQMEKDSIFSASGSPSSWLFYLSTNHLQNICKILVDIGNDPNQKEHLGTFRIDMLTLLIDSIKAKSTFKRKLQNQNYLSVELWYFLVEWFFQFNNLYHSKFFSLIKELFSQQHLPSIKHFCTSHLNRFISFYMSNDDESEGRGIVLLLLNYIRIAATQFPKNHFLVTFLISNEQWRVLQNVLISDTLKQYTPNFVGDNSIELISFGSVFAESIGFNNYDDHSKNNSTNKKILVDEFQTGGNAIESITSTPPMSADEIAKIEQELLKDDENKNKKKKNNNNKKKK